MSRFAIVVVLVELVAAAEEARLRLLELEVFGFGAVAASLSAGFYGAVHLDALHLPSAGLVWRHDDCGAGTEYGHAITFNTHNRM